MGKYGDVALRATALVKERSCSSPVDAWETAARAEFVGKPAAQKKSCPKGTFLGLCEAGLVANVGRGSFTTSRDNKGYALKAVDLLRRDPSLASRGPTVLWNKVMDGTEKRPNSQMEVVLALWNQGVIARR